MAAVVAWIVHAQWPFVTMDQPMKGGLPRTALISEADHLSEISALRLQIAELERKASQLDFIERMVMEHFVFSAEFERTEFHEGAKPNQVKIFTIPTQRIKAPTFKEALSATIGAQIK